MEEPAHLESIQENSRQHLAENLKLLIDSHKLSISQLAQNLNIPVMTIRRLISGQTEDPRIHTLKLFADYFNVSVDSLIAPTCQALPASLKHTKSQFVPILDWHTAQNIQSLNEITLSQWENWQPVNLNANEPISTRAFALESRPSMYPRFPQGTIFIIDPQVKPTDGDTVLVKIKSDGELTLRNLTIDPPERKLSPLTHGSTTLLYNTDDHEIIGVNVLTMLYNRRCYE